MLVQISARGLDQPSSFFGGVPLMTQDEQSGDIYLSGQDRVHIELADFINVVEQEGLTRYISKPFRKRYEYGRELLINILCFQ